jgi:hypothetical protein
MNELEDAKKCLVDGIPEVNYYIYYSDISKRNRSK